MVLGRAVLVPAGVKLGEKHIWIEAAAADGGIWKKDGAFALAAGPTATVRPAEPWPFFHNDAGHRGFLTKGPQPPLSLAWATNIGGTIHISSPVIADGRVYAGSSYEQSLADCAVSAVDLQTGRKIWRAPVDSSIKHSLAACNGSVLAVSTAGTLYCFNRDGQERWTASLDREHDDRWDTSFPIAEGKTVYAGRSTGFGAFDLDTGRRLWSQPGGRDWWPNIYSGPSLGGGSALPGRAVHPGDRPGQGRRALARAQLAVSTVAVVPAAVEHQEQATACTCFRTATRSSAEAKTGKNDLDRPTERHGEIVPWVTRPARPLWARTWSAWVVPRPPRPARRPRRPCTPLTSPPAFSAALPGRAGTRHPRCPTSARVPPSVLANHRWPHGLFRLRRRLVLRPGGRQRKAGVAILARPAHRLHAGRVG